MAKYSLKAIRVNANETQEETAKAIGISVETWANYEKGIRQPTAPTIKKIMEVYETTFDDIIFCTKEL